MIMIIGTNRHQKAVMHWSNANAQVHPLSNRNSVTLAKLSTIYEVYDFASCNPADVFCAEGGGMNIKLILIFNQKVCLKVKKEL